MSKKDDELREMALRWKEESDINTIQMEKYESSMSRAESSYFSGFCYGQSVVYEKCATMLLEKLNDPSREKDR